MTTIYITDDMLTDGVVDAYYADRVSLAEITIPIQLGHTPFNEEAYVAPADAEDPQLTGDTFGARIYELSHFDDSFGLVEGSGADAVYGGGGNDHLSSSDFGPGTKLDGGDGDDVLTGASPDRDHLRGDNGNDVLIMGDTDQGYGGAGSDRFVLSFGQSSAFITDLQADGTYHDVVDLWEALNVTGYHYNSFTEAMNAGTLGVRYANGYTDLMFDSDGDHIAEHEVAHIKGVVTPDLYDSAFLVTYAQSYYGKILAGNDVLDGTANPGRDHLLGENGSDTLIMGDTDEATGGTAADRFVLTNANGASAFITDLYTPGGYDVVDLWKPLHDAGYAYDTFTEAKDAGTLGVAYAHGYTYLSFDTDGDHVPDHEFAHIRGTVPAEFLDQTFLVSYENSYYQQAGLA